MTSMESFELMIARRKRERSISIRDGQWYAVKTEPGSQLPRREFITEPTSLGHDGKPRGKGYRIVPNIRHDLSAIERALEEAGFEYYMPSEKRLVRDRRHTDLWKTRRFALMVGYIFVRDPHDWGRLADTRGVSGVVRAPDGRALPMSILDMMAIRSVEAEYDAVFDIQSKNARAKLRKKAKADPRLKKLTSALDMAGIMTVPINSPIFDGAAA